MVVESENGVVIESYTDDWELQRILYETLTESELGTTFCLQFIDPYGDTTFNMLQKPVLVAELRSLQKKCRAGDREYLEPMIEFLAKHEEEIHTYVKFYGD